MSDRLPDAGPYRRNETVLPGWLFAAVVRCGAALVIAAFLWLIVVLISRVPLVSVTIAVALLLTALLSPTAARLRRRGVPSVVAAAASVVVLLGVPAGALVLLWRQVSQQFAELVPAVTAAIDRIREYLVDGPLSLEPGQVDHLRNQLVSSVERALPQPAGAAQMALQVLTAAVLVVFTVLFLLKDGRSMWRWLLDRTPQSRRVRIDGAGQHAWTTLTRYMEGTTVVALVDAVLIGAGLLIMGVPLWLPLTLITFLGGYVPLVGATVAGAVAVLVALVTGGFTDALIILAVVLVVQQVEGNVLQPLIMGRAVYIHPVVTLLAVTTGTLLLGIPGALVAVPIVAVSYQTFEYLRTHPAETTTTSTEFGAGEPRTEHGRLRVRPGEDPGMARND